MAAEKPGPEQPDTYAEQKEEQSDFETLVEEKGDFQKAVDAERRGEEPTEEEKPSSQA
jgi:hypothetical protein